MFIVLDVEKMITSPKVIEWDKILAEIHKCLDRDMRRIRRNIPTYYLGIHPSYKIRGGEWEMIFVILARFKGKITRENLERTNKIIASEPRIKVLAFYWTLGRYDAVLIVEGPDEKTVMKLNLQAGDYAATETMVAVSREEAMKLL